MDQNRFENFISVEGIFSFFKNSGYEIEEDLTPFPVSELIEKSIEGEVWMIIDQQDLTALIIKAESYNRKTFRTKINNYLRDIVGMKIIFYTQDFSHYNLTFIYNGIYNVKYKPDDPEIGAIRVLESLENKEDLFDLTKEDVNIVLLERELTAKELIEAIKTGDNSSVKIIFQEGGLNLVGTGKNKIIISHKDAPIPDMAVDVKLDYAHKKIDKNEIDIINTLYNEKTGNELKLICLITKIGVLYHWNAYNLSGFIKYVNVLNENVIEDVLESLIAQVSYRTAFNSETFHQQFGTYSPFFILGINLFKKYIEEEHEKISILYEEWKIRFAKVYQSGDLDEELFLKHSYLSLLIKTVLISKFLSDLEDITGQESLEKLFNIFEERGIPIFINDFFQWSIEEKNVQIEVFIAIKDANFIVDDLFRTIYQEMVSPATRHALGEFYTPAPLAREMVQETYEFGQYVLDPACGSGTFLVEILNIIDNENRPIQEKVDAFSKIYGLDVNPIAVLVSRSNLLLLTDKLFKDPKKVSINVYLTDSLNPIDEFKPIMKDKKRGKKVTFQSLEKWSEFGEVERFNMPAINDSLIINKKFFKYPDHFGEILKELDKNLSKDINFEELLKKLYLSTDHDWLEETCEGNSRKKLKENLEFIAQKFYNYIKEDKNHIWAYLLFNAIGVRKMKETMDGVDLIIGNPPWITINSILSKNYKETVKEMSKELDLYMGGKHTPNTEICSIFFYKVSNIYLRKNGKILFVTPASLETGDQHSKFRLFNGFKDVYLWKFQADVFRIHNICIGATFSSEQPLLERLKINMKLFNVYKKKKMWKFDEEETNIYVPYNYDNIQDDNIAKRLIQQDKLEVLLPYEESIYHKHFNRGADLFPRIFYFIKIKKNGDIVPDESLQTHEPWDFYPVDNYDIEERYIYSVCKSTELVPFCLLSEMKCFVPVEREDLLYHRETILPRASALFDQFMEIYRKFQERDERQITNLWERLNYHNCLSNPMQHSQIKVIYNSTGSIVKSAIVKGQIIIDTSLYYFGLENENEAYYICTILNAQCISKQIERTASTGASGSVRTIHKRALDFPIPRYDASNEFHNKIIELGKICEKKVKKIIKELKTKELNRLKKRIRCIKCGTSYSKSTFKRYRESHQEKCENVGPDYTWSDEDWEDLKDITLDEIELSRMKTQNEIFNDEEMQENLNNLDKLVIELLTSESD